MSSSPGVSKEGGKNEDVEADESARTEDGRITNYGMDNQDYVEFEDDVLGEESFATAEESADIGPEANSKQPADDDGEYEDFLQLNNESEHFGKENNSFESPDFGPSTPKAPSPLGSPADSGSIPDDTPSLQGSLMSSPSHVVSTSRISSPGPRKSVPRTASGALQPFERRFESRFSSSPSSTPRAGSPGLLGPHSRQISLSSHISQISSQEGTAAGEETVLTPWEIIRWTKLRKITGQAFSEAGRRNFGRPTCLAISALIAIGTSKGLILGFDYHQTLKIIIGQGTTATECGSVTALAISADYSTVAAGHANGHIFTWEINRPARPFLRLPPLDESVLQQSQHPDGHVSGRAILHIGFLGTRHTALVSADAGGMAFSHLASRGLGPVTRTVKTTRLLGRYPTSDPMAQANRKPSSVLAFSPLPLGNVEQVTDGMGLTALLTPYLLVIVSTTPIAQTQYKSPRPKEIKPHGTLSGCLAWFPTVKLKTPSADGGRVNSDTKLVYCWSNVMSVLDVKVVEADDHSKPPNLEFHPRSRWRAEEAIVAVQWLGRSVLGVLTVSQRLLIVEDGSLQVTDSVDLLHRHIYHQDLFSTQLQAVVDRMDSEDPSLHGVVADAFYMSFRVYKGRIFLLGVNDLTVGTLSNWADRLMAFMENGDYIAAIRLATDYYAGSTSNVTIGLPENDSARHEMVKERLIAMISASLNYTFSQQNDERSLRLRELSGACYDACLRMGETKYLFSEIFEMFEEADEEDIFVTTLEPYVLEGEVKSLPPEVVKSVVSHFISENQPGRLEELLCRLDPMSFDLDEITVLCHQHCLYDALIYVWTQGIGDFVTPFFDLLSLVKMLQDDEDNEDLERNPFYTSAIKIFPYLAYSLTSRRYPSGERMDDYESSRIKADLYEYLFAGTPTAWPQGSKKVFRTKLNPSDEPAFPYLVLLLEFDTPSFMSMLNEAFEDAFLNEAEEDNGISDTSQANGIRSRSGYKMTRQHIISIMLDVIRQQYFEPEQVIYLDMFIARSLPKYPGQIVLSGALLEQVLARLCHPPSEILREDCQLSIEYLLSAYRPPNTSALVKALRSTRFYRVLKYVYRTDRSFTDYLEAYFEDPEDKIAVFDAIAFCLRPNTAATPKQIDAIKRTIMSHISDLATISVIHTARTLATYAHDLLKSAVDSFDDSYQQFIFLRCLLEPSLVPDEVTRDVISPLSSEDQSKFTEQYVQLMCLHDPTHVAPYINMLPSSDLRLSKVLPAMEQAGVIDAAVTLLARDGLARDAIDRLVSHLDSLQQGLIGLVEGASQAPDPVFLQEAADSLAEDVEKYTKVGIWLCQGQSASAQPRPRPRTNFTWAIKEDDLDLDEYLWLNLLDAVVHITKNITHTVNKGVHQVPEAGQSTADFSNICFSLRSNVQQVFTAVLAATVTSSTPEITREDGKPPAKQDNLSFVRILRAFLTRAAITAPSLSDLRAVLSDIFSAYTFEQGILSLASELLSSDVFSEIQEVNGLRQKGWRPRSQVCEHCKRRAWGQGIGEIIWEEWMRREAGREAEKARKLVERGGGEEARRMERGKAKVKTAIIAEQGEEDGEGESRKMTLVVFACRHVFHKSCLYPDYIDGKAPNGVMYKCPLCRNHA